MDVPCISVIVPTYNRCGMLANAMESLLRQDTAGQFTYEVIVVDNASTDATEDTVKRLAVDAPVPVRYCYESVPGPAPARNCGVSQAAGEWLAFFDDDEIAAPEWLLELFRAAITSEALIIGGRMALDLSPEILKGLNHFVRCTSLREIDYYPTVQPYTGRRLPGTNNALVAREVFSAIGSFDASIVAGGSDSDFFLRAQAAGMTLYYTPHAVVKHRVEPNRLTKEYFRWDAQQGCSAFAALDYEHKGSAMLLGRCAARLGHALLILLPRLMWARMRRDEAEVLGQRVRLWRTEGYVRKTAALLVPVWCAQTRYFATLEFRRGRVVGKDVAAVEVMS